MDKEYSISLCARIGSIIAEKSPVIDYTDKEVAEELATYSEDELCEMKELGLIGEGGFEEFYLLREFCARLGISQVDDDGMLIYELIRHGKMLSADEFEADEYIKNIKIKDRREGNILLTTSSYDRGEIFQYDMPDLSSRVAALRLGFFQRKVIFPAIYEGNTPWVSVIPSEMNSMLPKTEGARGKVLVLGLGLGYYPYIISSRPEVESITIVEISADVKRIFEECILPQFEHRDKIRVVLADAIEFMKTVEPEDYDFCFADIWEGAVDGARAYLQIKPHENRLKKTTFSYWIEEEILEYLDRKSKQGE